MYQCVTNNQYRDSITINRKHVKSKKVKKIYISDGEMISKKKNRKEIMRCDISEIERSNLELFKRAT